MCIRDRCGAGRESGDLTGCPTACVPQSPSFRACAPRAGLRGGAAPLLGLEIRQAWTASPLGRSGMGAPKGGTVRTYPLSAICSSRAVSERVSSRASSTGEGRASRVAVAQGPSAPPAAPREAQTRSTRMTDSSPRET